MQQADLSLSTSASKAQLCGDSVECPVAALAEEAARIIRTREAMSGLKEDDERSPFFAEFKAALESNGSAVASKYVDRHLFERLLTIQDIASHRRAQSLKGAIFQLYLAASRGAGISGWIKVGTLAHDDEIDVRNAENSVDRLARSALSVLEGLIDDPDIQVLRRWFYRPEMDPEPVARAVEEAANKAA